MFSVDSNFLHRILTIITVGFICYTIMSRMNQFEDRLHLVEKLMVKRHTKKKLKNVDEVAGQWMEQINEFREANREAAEAQARAQAEYEAEAEGQGGGHCQMEEAAAAEDLQDHDQETDSVVMDEDVLPPAESLIDMNQVALIGSLNETSLKKMSLKQIQSMCGEYNIEIMDGSKIKTKKKLIQELISSIN